MNFLRQNTLIITYAVVFIGLLYGVFLTSGTKYMADMLIFFTALLAFYTLIQLLATRVKFCRELADRLANYEPASWNALFIIIPAFVFILIHIIILKGSPGLKAFGMDHWADVAQLRESINQGMHPGIKYGASITMKALLPFALLYTFAKNRKLLYWVVFVVGTFYAFSLMQKSFILILLTPTILYGLLSKRWLHTGIQCLVLVGVIFLLGKLANPTLTVETDQQQVVTVETTDTIVKQEKSETTVGNLMKGLQRRLFVVPGMVITGWFEHIPGDKPFLGVEGYRLIAKMKGVEHKNYASELYPLMYPRYAEQGFKGTVNVASFMYDYANFGRLGLIWSGILLGSLFAFLEFLFRKKFKLKMSVNILGILFLSSGALTTLLFSGGWSFLIAFTFAFWGNDKST